MSQTAETKVALERDRLVCRWCLYKHHRVRHIYHSYIPGLRYHPLLAGGHHIGKRARVDNADLIICLCAECHGMAEDAKIPKIELLALLSYIVGYDLFRKYRREFKITDEEWAKTYDPEHREKLEIAQGISSEDC